MLKSVADNTWVLGAPATTAMQRIDGLLLIVNISGNGYKENIIKRLE